MSDKSEPSPDSSERASDHLQSRRSKLNALRAAGEEAFRINFERSHPISEVLASAEGMEPGENSDMGVRVAGRLMGFRRQGKLVFADLTDATGKIQLLMQANRLGERFGLLDNLDLGDWLGAWGKVIRTKRGEPSVAVEGFEVLTKGLRPLPEKWHGLKDVEQRHRQRYLDLIVNEDARSVMRLRSAAVAFMRSWLMERSFIEVETPMLQPIAGGALAKPFVTYHEALNMELYLRVAPELYLKRLVVGGMEKVFEINRNFRNEGVSVRHNPEFTMLEAYQAFADYLDMATLLEGLVSETAQNVRGTTKLEYQGEILDLTPPYRRARLIDLVAEAGVDVETDLAAECARLGVAHDPRWSRGKLLLELYEKLVERNLMQPTFVLDYPREVSPLARTHRSDDQFTEHLDLVIAGMEVGVAYSELTDPIDQRARFEEQAQDRGDEAHSMDEDFLQALEYGMPPTGGLGFGIDRFLMLLTDQASIREVILFPAMRPLDAGTPTNASSPPAVDPSQIPELLIVGTERVASALVGLAERAGFHVRVAAGPEPPLVGTFEGADEVIVTREPHHVEALRPGDNTHVVICSEVQEFAQAVLYTLMPSEAPYLGLMVNKNKTAAVFEELQNRGFSEEQIGRVHMPIGLEVGSKTPEEIAVSILAEIVAVRRGAKTAAKARPGRARPSPCS